LIVAPFAAAMTFGGLEQVSRLYKETCAMRPNAQAPAQVKEEMARLMAEVAPAFEGSHQTHSTNAPVRFTVITGAVRGGWCPDTP
jgi:hypothetical protein